MCERHPGEVLWRLPSLLPLHEAYSSELQADRFFQNWYLSYGHFHRYIPKVTEYYLICFFAVRGIDAETCLRHPYSFPSGFLHCRQWRMRRVRCSSTTVPEMVCAGGSMKNQQKDHEGCLWYILFLRPSNVVLVVCISFSEFQIIKSANIIKVHFF